MPCHALPGAVEINNTTFVTPLEGARGVDFKLRPGADQENMANLQRTNDVVPTNKPTQHRKPKNAPLDETGIAAGRNLPAVVVNLHLAAFGKQMKKKSNAGADWATKDTRAADPAGFRAACKKDAELLAEQTRVLESAFEAVGTAKAVFVGLYSALTETKNFAVARLVVEFGDPLKLIKLIAKAGTEAPGTRFRKGMSEEAIEKKMEKKKKENEAFNVIKEALRRPCWRCRRSTWGFDPAGGPSSPA